MSSYNYINKNTINPYRLKPYKESIVKIIPKIPNTALGLIHMELSGEFGDRKAFMTTGYKNDQDGNNVFLVDVNELRNMRKMIDDMIQDIEEDQQNKYNLDETLKEFHRYLDQEYVKEITLTKLKLNMPGFNPNLYDLFKVEVRFKAELPIEAGINLGFNFFYCMHLSISEKDYHDTLDYLFGGHLDKFESEGVTVKIIGYDRDQAIRKYIESAKKDLKNFDPSKDHVLTEKDKEIIKGYYENS